jgi:type III pantothenate kinase
MTYLIIDAGNTRVKVFVFEEDSILFSVSSDEDSLNKNFEKIFLKYNISKIILSSVGAMREKIALFIIGKAPVLMLSNQTKVPFVNRYKTPKTLGVDRIALMAAAANLFPKKNVLVIDAGTCITYDFLNKDNEYVGGAISLGLQMRYKALHTFTEKLPELNFKAPENLIGSDTDSSIHSGVVNGLVAEIKGVVDAYEQKYSDLTIVLTGGDTIYLSKRLKNGIFANPNFLVEGLNAILKYNT